MKTKESGGQRRPRVPKLGQKKCATAGNLDRKDVQDILGKGTHQVLGAVGNLG